MAARSSGTGTISFGLVTIPVKLYSATSSHGVGFHLLHKKCGTRLKMQYVCPFDGDVVDRADTIRGFEHAKEQYIEITDEEIDSLRPETTDRIDLLEFVPAETVDFLYIERTSYLGPDKSGARAYKLLADSMDRMRRIGVGRYGARGKDQLVLLRPYHGGLVMHQVHYADEVRSFEEVAPPTKVEFRPEEEALADRLIGQLSTEAFHPEKYHDDYQERLLEAIERQPHRPAVGEQARHGHIVRQQRHVLAAKRAAEIGEMALQILDGVGRLGVGQQVGDCLQRVCRSLHAQHQRQAFVGGVVPGKTAFRLHEEGIGRLGLKALFEQPARLSAGKLRTNGAAVFFRTPCRGGIGFGPGGNLAATKTRRHHPAVLDRRECIRAGGI